MKTEKIFTQGSKEVKTRGRTLKNNQGFTDNPLKFSVG